AESRSGVAARSACPTAPGCKPRARAPWRTNRHEKFAAGARWFHPSPGRQGLPQPSALLPDSDHVVARLEPARHVVAPLRDCQVIPVPKAPRSAAGACLIPPAAPIFPLSPGLLGCLELPGPLRYLPREPVDH